MKQTPTPHRRARKASPQEPSEAPLFLTLEQETLPVTLTAQAIAKLRRSIQAWSTYIERLTSSSALDQDTALLVARAHLRRGVAHTVLSEWQAALRDLSQVILMECGEAEKNTARLFRTSVYEALRMDEPSLQDWTAVLAAIEQATPPCFSATLASQCYASRGRLCARKGRYAEAVADCDRALIFDAQCAEAYSVRGSALFHLNQREQALRDCTTAITLEGWPIHWYRRGLLQKRLGNLEQALADMEQAYQREPDNALYFQERTDLLLRQVLGLERQKG